MLHSWDWLNQHDHKPKIGSKRRSAPIIEWACDFNIRSYIRRLMGQAGKTFASHLKEQKLLPTSISVLITLSVRGVDTEPLTESNRKSKVVQSMQLLCTSPLKLLCTTFFKGIKGLLITSAVSELLALG